MEKQEGHLGRTRTEMRENHIHAGDGGRVQEHVARRAERHQGRRRLRGRVSHRGQAQERPCGLQDACHPGHRLRHRVAGHLGRLLPAVRLRCHDVLDTQAHTREAEAQTGHPVQPQGDVRGVRAGVPTHRRLPGHRPVRRDDVPAHPPVLLAEHFGGR